MPKSMINMIFFAWVGAAIAALYIIFLSVTVHAADESSFNFRTMDQQIDDMYSPKARKVAEDDGVYITNGQTGVRRRHNARGSVATDRAREVCGKVYEGDDLGYRMCMDNAARVRSNDFDRYLGIGIWGRSPSR